MKLLLTSVFLFASVAVFSQRNYFVLIESEKSQPFYVRIGDINYSSSSFGHVILPDLSDSAYTLEIGFPKDQFPINQFVIRIKKKDHGFQLKNLPDKGWVLFDYQTLELIYPVHKQDGLSQTGYSLVKRNDPFSKLLSQVVNDTSVLYTIVYNKPVEPPPPAPARTTVDSAVVKKDEKPKPEAEIHKEGPTMPLILKVGEISNDNGKQITYMDNHDSVQIFIEAEAPKKESAKEAQSSPSSNTTNNQGIVTTVPVITKSQDPVQPAEKKEQPPIENKGKAEKPVETQNKLTPADTIAVVKSGGTAITKPKDSVASVDHNATKDTGLPQKKMVLVNSDCKAIAWDNDVDKLRIKMLAAKDVDEKINVARKVFKTKCFSSSQVKGLTELFTTDEEKYKFLDAAYPFVVDTDNFKDLSYLLTDPYYVKRFRAMVRLD